MPSPAPGPAIACGEEDPIATLQRRLWLADLERRTEAARQALQEAMAPRSPRVKDLPQLAVELQALEEEQRRVEHLATAEVFSMPPEVPSEVVLSAADVREFLAESPESTVPDSLLAVVQRAVRQEVAAETSRLREEMQILREEQKAVEAETRRLLQEQGAEVQTLREERRAMQEEIRRLRGGGGITAPRIKGTLRTYWDGRAEWAELNRRQASKDPDTAAVALLKDQPLLQSVSLDKGQDDLTLQAIADHCILVHSLRCPNAAVRSGQGLVAIARNAYLRELDIRNCAIPSADVVEVARLCPGITSLDISADAYFDPDDVYWELSAREMSVQELQSLASFLPLLRRLTANGATLSANHFHQARFPSLTALEARHTVSDDCIRPLATACPLLQDLELSWLPHHDFSELTCRGFHRASFPRLQTLRLGRIVELTDQTLGKVARSCSALQVLHIRGDNEVSKNGVADLLRMCPHMTDVFADDPKIFVGLPPSRCRFH